jgi:dTDP-4-dehydrorhamnose reductase
MSGTLLVLGASGLTGYKAMQLAKKKGYPTYGTYNIRTSSDSSLLKLDIANEDALKKLFRDIRPSIVLNATALHNVDYCETHLEEAFKINSTVVGQIAGLCNNLGSRLIHLSTDFVFNGEKNGGYTESDTPNPQSVYAKSKLEGEMQAKKTDSYSILRSSVIYGWTPLETQGSTSSSGKPMNFALWALSKMNKGEDLKVVSDQYTSPTLADVLAEVALMIAEQEKNELYHVAGTSCLSRYEFTKKIAITMGYSRVSIKPVESKSFAQVAKRPINSCLDCEKLQNELKYELPNIDQSLAIMYSQIKVESPSLLRN